MGELWSNAARTDGIHAVDRRRWSFREVAPNLALNADDDRAEALRAVGRQLVAKASEVDPSGRSDDPIDDEAVCSETATAQKWAKWLDRDAYEVIEIDGKCFVAPVAGEELSAALAPTGDDFNRGGGALRLLQRYPERNDHRTERSRVELDELVADIEIARDLLRNPPPIAPVEPIEAVAAVAAAALETRYVDGLLVPDDDVVWAASTLIESVNRLADGGAIDDERSPLGWGVPCAAARAIPLLWLPGADTLRIRLKTEALDEERIGKGARWLATNGSYEARLFFARALDSLWRTVCGGSGATCHHVHALEFVEDMARDCMIGAWDVERQERTRPRIAGCLADALGEAQHERIEISCLSSTIRAAAIAAASPTCCKNEAAELLRAALAAHRREMHRADCGYEQNLNDDALVVGRALLDVSTPGDASLLEAHIDDYVEDALLLYGFLTALAAAGEETRERADAARRLWPSIVDWILDHIERGGRPRGDGVYRSAALAALLPAHVPSGYFHREFTGDPIRWSDAVSLKPQIDRWVTVVPGSAWAVDALLDLLLGLRQEQQAELGLPWVDTLVTSKASAVANRSYDLPKWLRAMRQHALSKDLCAIWDRIVDALTVAGDQQVAALAD